MRKRSNIAADFVQMKIILALLFVLLAPALAFSQVWTMTDYGVYGGRVSSVINSGSNLLAGTAYGGVMLSTDNGATWHQSNSGLTHPGITGPLQVNMLLNMGGKVFAGTISGLFVSSDDGATWTSTALNAGYIAIIGSLGSTLYASDFSYVYVSTDLGVTWQTSSLLNCSSVTVSNTNFIAGNGNGDIYRSTDNGLTWSKVASVGGYINSVIGNGNTVIASTYSGMYRSADGGVTWTKSPANFFTIGSMSYFNGVFYGTTYNSVAQSTDDGITWVNTASNDFPVARQVGGTDIYSIAVQGWGLGISTDNGSTYTYPASVGLVGPNISGIIASGNALIVTTSNGIKISTDGGDNWTYSNTGLSNAIPSCIILNGNSILIGTQNNGVFISNDNGSTWANSNTGLTSLRVSCISASSGKIALGTELGVFVSSDGGSSWAPTNMTSNVISIAIQSNVIYAATNNGFYKSSDNGQTWSVAFNLFYSSYQTRVISFGNYVVLGTSNGIYYTANGGTTWTKLSNQFDGITITNLATDGTTLFFSTNNGDIYASGLNSLQLISQRLPVNSSFSGMCFVNGETYAALDASYYFGSGSVWHTTVNNLVSISTITPSAATVGSTITITGNNFNSTPSHNVVVFGGVNTIGYTSTTSFFGGVTQATPTQLTVSVPAGSGIHPIKIIANGQTITTLNSFHIIPQITNITPPAATIGSMITIEGSGFDCTALHTVLFNGQLSSNISNCTTTKLQVSVPGQARPGKISIVDSDQNTYASPMSLAIIPQISQVSPSSGPVGTHVNILGTGFDPSVPGNNIVKFNGVRAIDVSVSYYGGITVAVPAGAASGNITVETTGFLASSPIPFLVTPLDSGCLETLTQPRIVIKIQQAYSAELHSTAKGKISWYKDGALITGASDSTIAVSDAGNYTVQSNINGCLSPMSEPVAVTITAETKNFDQVEVFPNPTTTSLTVNLRSLAPDEVQLDVFDSMGQKLTHVLTQGGRYVELPMTAYAPGMYLIEIKHPSKTVQKKIIKY